MFGLMLKSTHFAVVRDLMADVRKAKKVCDALDAKLAAVKEGSRIIREERNLAAAERDEARAELARWKPARDAKGHFVKAEAQKERA